MNPFFISNKCLRETEKWKILTENKVEEERGRERENIKYDILIEIRVIRTQLLWVYTNNQRIVLNLSLQRWSAA